MRPRRPAPPLERPGQTMVMFLIVLTALLGMVGLVVDIGLMMGSHRRVQNAADAAAVAAAREMMRGGSADAARAAATRFVQTDNGLPDAAVTVNIPPKTGPHAGNPRYAEAIISRPYDTIFVQLVGADQDQQVSARSVAGFEAVTSGEGAIVLDPLSSYGLSVSGSAVLQVDGAIVVNSGGAGYDQYGAWLDPYGIQQYAASVGNNGTIKARHLQIRGGVSDPLTNYQNLDPGGPSPLYCGAPMSADPLRQLPVPMPGNAGITDWTLRTTPTFSTTNTTLQPGVYRNIVIGTNNVVTFSPGVYVICPSSPGDGLSITGDCTVTGNGVMFYLAGSKYLNTSPGYWDNIDDTTNAALDGPLPPTNWTPPKGDWPPVPPAPTGEAFDRNVVAGLTINAGQNASVNLVGLTDTNSPFSGVLFYQRRRNATNANIQGQSGTNVLLSGTIYAKWTRFKVAGGGRFDAQFVVGSIEVTGNSNITVDRFTGKHFGRANQVFLVE